MFNKTRLTSIIAVVNSLSSKMVPMVSLINTVPNKLCFTSETKGLLDALEDAGGYIYCHTEISSSHPTVELFLSHMQHVHGLAQIKLQELDEDTANVIARDINQALSAFHQALYSKEHQKRLDNRLRAAPRNSQSLEKYIPTLFLKHAKLLFIRLDLAYKEKVYCRLTPETAMEDRRRYLAIIKRQFPGLVGYIWKMEYGQDRRFHMHTVFIFNGARHQRDRSLGRLLGEHWEEYTNDLGTYFNCAHLRKQYQEWGNDGIGMVHCDDEQKQEKLFKALEYLTKHDELMLATLPSGRRTFGRMEIPEASRRRGRPRIRRSGLPVLI
ncbi:inovirus Gp2 family protein [Aeromonas media]|uniref:Inovirus Gp2 family protein n=1 Tax=Aeromonas media TaxID=651 RepID=A0ABX6NN52_AERME|nr:inovirus-type Gp2 protein [Aeromonas media]QJT35943.1 inovirus Gp2 family protein [Aeromonas media]QJT37773.1 inovirus Gp2 family protein [Aeromonas media]